jgi:hypothetical protein
METEMIAFLSGALTMGFMIAGLFFFRFWRRTGDVFFCFFGISFWLLAGSQALSIMHGMPNDDQSWIYLLRLAAFVVLIIGIISKNLDRFQPRDPLQGQ